MTVEARQWPIPTFAEIVLDSARISPVSRLTGQDAFTSGMGVITVSTTQAAELLGVSEQTVRNRIAADKIHGVTMDGGAWRIPLKSIRTDPAVERVQNLSEAKPPLYVQRLIERLDEFDAGMIPCAEAARIAGVGVKAMRNGLRSGRVPGGRLLGGSWLVSVAEFGAWLGIERAA